MTGAGRVLCGIGCGLLVLLLGLSAYNGLYEGMNAVRTAAGTGMRVATVTQLLYGACSVLALLALAVRRAWVEPLLIGWGVAVTLTAGLAPIVYGGTAVWPGLAAGLATALLAWLTLALWRIARRAAALGRATAG